MVSSFIVANGRIGGVTLFDVYIIQCLEIADLSVWAIVDYFIWRCFEMGKERFL